MLVADMKERHTGRIELTDIKLSTGLELIAYLYNGWVERYDNFFELLKLADKYDLSELRETCSDALEGTITNGSCLELLLLADLHQVASLKHAALRWVSLNSSSLFQTEDWDAKIRGYPSLMKEIIEAIVKKE